MKKQIKKKKKKRKNLTEGEDVRRRGGALRPHQLGKRRGAPRGCRSGGGGGGGLRGRGPPGERRRSGGGRRRLPLLGSRSGGRGSRSGSSRGLRRARPGLRPQDLAQRAQGLLLLARGSCRLCRRRQCCRRRRFRNCCRRQRLRRPALLLLLLLRCSPSSPSPCRCLHLRLPLQGQAPGDVRVDEGARHGAEADGADDEGRALFGFEVQFFFSSSSDERDSEQDGGKNHPFFLAPPLPRYRRFAWQRQGDEHPGISRTCVRGAEAGVLLFPPPALDLRFFEESAAPPVVAPATGVGCVCWVVAPPPPPSSSLSCAFLSRFAAWEKMGKRSFLSAIL